MRIDFHTHTNYSFDAWTSVEGALKAAQRAGLGGIAITDHGEFTGCLKALQIIRDRHLQLRLVSGMEIQTEFGEILALCISEAVRSKFFAEACDEIHAQGAFVVIPHPFDSLRGSACNPKKLGADLLKQVDGIEAFNSRCTFPSSNSKAADYAAENFALATAGSDAHFPFEIGAAWGEIPNGMEPEIALRKGAVTPGGHSTIPLVHGPTTLLKQMRKWGLFKPKI